MKRLHIFRLWLVACLALPLMMTAAGSAIAGVTAKIDISEQRMRIYVNGRQVYTWKVSTGRSGYRTPTGNYRPQRMYRRYFSTKYNNSPMPYSVFFRGGYAIHGTNYVRSLGRVASHGCIRLAPGNARIFFNLIRQHGTNRTNIIIQQ
ncbi:MAG: L,D-transpeptidase [Fimbriimonadaceae bacterium]|nr:L,D-transpeptidase [Alphaproteobacteria bacterium]